MREILIKEEYIKLQSLLKYANIVNTGGEAKNIILDGCIKLNDEVVLQRGKKIKKGDIIEINIEFLNIKEKIKIV